MLVRSSLVAAALVAAPLVAASPAAAALGVRTVASGLNAPIFVTQPANDPRLFVLERGGTIRTVQNGVSSAYATIPGVSTLGEGGLLGLAFAPDFATSGNLYVHYTAANTSNGLDTVIGRVTAGSPSAASLGTVTPQTILRFATPFTNHKGGWIGFKPGDAAGRNLYVPTGDGGDANDPGNRSQTLSTLFGKVLRLDVLGPDAFPADVNQNYAIPTDNFFAADGNANTRGEIIAYGLRNPFRDSFDRANGNLLIGDVGQGAREEVDLLPSSTQGQNFGWRLREGNIQTPGVGGAAPADYVGPIYDYVHSGEAISGASITGGYVYRGERLGAAYEGKYLFGDFVAKRFFMLDPYAADVEASAVDITSQLFPAGFGGNLVSFGEDSAGELYVVDLNGTVYQIVPEPTMLLAGTAAVALLRRRRRH